MQENGKRLERAAEKSEALRDGAGQFEKLTKKLVAKQKLKAEQLNKLTQAFDPRKLFQSSSKVAPENSEKQVSEEAIDITAKSSAIMSNNSTKNEINSVDKSRGAASSKSILTKLKDVIQYVSKMPSRVIQYISNMISASAQRDNPNQSNQTTTINPKPVERSKGIAPSGTPNVSTAKKVRGQSR